MGSIWKSSGILGLGDLFEVPGGHQLSRSLGDICEASWKWVASRHLKSSGTHQGDIREASGGIREASGSHLEGI